MAYGELLIAEFLAIDALATCTIELCEVAALSHKVRNDAMENAVLIVEHLSRSATTCLTST